MFRGKVRCSTCVHWEAEPEFVNVRGDMVRLAGLCGGIASSWDWRLSPGDPLPGDEALLVDANAVLLTRPEFGCSLHERRR